jgi:hypothetical protein
MIENFSNSSHNIAILCNYFYIGKNLYINQHEIINSRGEMPENQLNCTSIHGVGTDSVWRSREYLLTDGPIGCMTGLKTLVSDFK